MCHFMIRFFWLISTFDIRVLEDSVTNNGIQQCGQVVSINEDRKHRKVLTLKINAQQRRRLRSRWEQSVIKILHKKKGQIWEESEGEINAGIGFTITQIKWKHLRNNKKKVLLQKTV